MPSNDLELRQGSETIIYRPKYPVSQQRKRKVLTLRDTQLKFRNFAGKAKQFNEEGERNFSVILDEELARELEKQGWNIKPLKSYGDEEEGDEQLYQLPVKVSFKFQPPRIYMVTGDGIQMPMRKALLPEDMLYMMDSLDLEACHLVVAGSNWSTGGRSGMSAYLQSLFGHVRLDELEAEYAHIEDMIAEDTAAHPIVIDGEIVD